MKKLLLASQSPRRRELMQYLEVPFGVVSPTSTEVYDSSKTLREQIEAIAYDKAKSVIDSNEESIIIGADTIVTIDGEILGKPHSEEEAVSMLQKLSGRSHEVITGVAIVSSLKEVVFSTVAKVHFFELTEEEIKNYVDSKEPMDKAGSYSIQGYASRFVSGIEGDFYTVMGLPVSALYQELKKGGF